ncbi:hypothetical protein [Nocardioides cavernaquae]|uniref:DUF8017 domain-containing protein n=1 Tax=Nocardioides cavernaquae TaxID=2321396 RepID=A0A3A5H6C4_9ACTN|nr:hypothetical protein [Nocardioides cavernaquae]RJS46239.1 hypothetical protein D4739_08460 [Nocardioides cavernaquae]
MTSLPRLRSVATVVAVVGLCCVVALGVLGAVLRTPPGSAEQRPGEAASAALSAVPPAAAAVPAPAVTVPAGWRRVSGPDGSSYAVPPGWRSRPLEEAVAYRDEGQVTVEGLALSQSWANDCRADMAPVPVAWALLGAPVRSTNPEGVARAAAAGWVRGYAAMRSGAEVPAPSVRAIDLAEGERAVAASVTLDLKDSANPCAGDTAELTVVGLVAGDEVRSLVVARFLGVGGSPSDAAYTAVLGSLRQS